MIEQPLLIRVSQAEKLSIQEIRRHGKNRGGFDRSRHAQVNNTYLNAISIPRAYLTGEAHGCIAAKTARQDEYLQLTSHAYPFSEQRLVSTFA